MSKKLVLYTASGSSIHVGELHGSGKAKKYYLNNLLLDNPWSAFKINDTTIERMTDGRQAAGKGKRGKADTRSMTTPAISRLILEGGRAGR